MNEREYDFLFPGQGAQYPGMGKDLYDASDGVKRLFAIADEQADFDVCRVIFEGTEEELKATDKTQIAITLINLSVACVLRERGIYSHQLAGFSLGEYAALVEAEVLSVEDAFTAVRIRGEIMEEVSRFFDSEAGQAGMAAIIGPDVETVSSVIADSGIHDLYVAIHNSPTQTVIAGRAESLLAIKAPMERAGVQRYVPLRVSGPFHCPLMQEARERFGEELGSITFKEPIKPIYSNVSATQMFSGAEAKRMCIDQLVSPVRWTEEQLALVADGSNGVLEVGPGTVLTGLWRALTRTYPQLGAFKCRPSDTLDRIDAIVQAQ